jgi:signal transduction histidine kinase
VTRRLVLSYLALAVLILLILEVPLAVLAQRFERDLVVAQAEREASGLVAVASGYIDSEHTADLGSVVADYERRTGGEVIVVGASGTAVASSSAEAYRDADDDWLSLSRRALRGAASSAFRTDEGRPEAVAAVPVESDGRIVGAVILGAPAGAAVTRIHAIWLALGVFAAAALVVAVAAGVLLARSMALPLGQLEAAVDRFGRGDLDSRARDLIGPPEIRSLARQFNQMADRLDELVEAQKRFVADASHQLRSPLTALRLRIENLEATADDDTGGAISAVGRELQRMSRLVDGLLTLSRAGQDQPQRVPVRVDGVIVERCEAWSALAAERRVELARAPGRPVDPVVQLVPGDLEQILDNLLANAVEVSPSGGCISVAVARGSSGLAEIQVRDEGPGLDAVGRQRAFERFWQGPDGSSGHSGLGLAIVRQLAVRNGMHVELRAVEPHGLEAVVVLPAAR